MTSIGSIPDDLAACQALIETQQAIIDQLQQQLEQMQGTSDQQSETIETLQQTIEKLRHEVQLLKRHIFGQRRERFEDPRQQKLFGNSEQTEPADPPAEEGDPEEASPRPRGRGHGRRPLPDFLPRQDEIYELDEKERICPCCGKPRMKVSEEVSEQLDFQPASLFVRRHVRFIYACEEDDCEANMVTAPKPPQPIAKGLAGPGLLGFVAASKLADHLPLNRQEDITSRYGVHLARSTLCGWMAACANLVKPLQELMIALVLESKVLGTDDTTVKVRDRELDHTRTGYFWAYVGDQDHPYICYDFTTGHSRDGPEKFLEGFEGYLQGDAYSGYIEISRASAGKIQHAGCWSHARRYYDRARKIAPTVQVHEALSYIQRLYDVEDEAATMTSEDRLRLRRDKSVIILNEFYRWLGEQQATVLPKSAMGEAITYTLNHWESLKLYTEDGDIPIDNNRTEHALRQQVLGRVNWLFLGSDQGGETAAVLYTLVGTCKRLRIDPFAYLRDVFTRMPTISTQDQLKELLPDIWIKEHPEYRLVHREREAEGAKKRRRQRRAQRRQLQNANAE